MDDRFIIREVCSLRYLKYDSTVSNRLRCMICKSALVEPMVAPCDCIKNATSASKKCPLDGSRLDSQKDLKSAQRIITSMLDELIAHCPNHLGGSCKESHTKNDCPKELVTCTAKGDCTWIGFRKDLTKHRESHGDNPGKVTMDTLRGYRLVHCPLCRDAFTPAGLEYHYVYCSRPNASNEEIARIQREMMNRDIGRRELRDYIDSILLDDEDDY
ncbi:hypothetical protein BC940DRAFT_349111 [Gongronella butleri]|nr:hypothetical protein BC940DRAFT_349111 [Gongronella butleri]